MGLDILSGTICNEDTQGKLDQIRDYDESLTQVDFGNLELSSTENVIFFLKTLAGTASGNKHLKVMNLSGNKIDKSGVEAVIDFLKEAANIQSLSLENCSIDGAVLKTLLIFLRNETPVKLHKLKLGGNELDGMQTMISRIRSDDDL